MGIVGFIILFKLFFSGGTNHSSSRVWRGSNWQLKIPTWAKHEVEQDQLGFMPLDETVEEMCAHYRWVPYKDRYHRRKVYDLILVNDELDTLLLRMGEMDQVDYFVILESDVTFTDLPKPLHVAENWDMFAEHHHRMIRRTLNLTGQEFGDQWARERFNRNAMFDQVFLTLEDEEIAQHGDVIIVADVDELVRPPVLTALRNCEIPKRVQLWTRFFYYSYQWLQPESHSNWPHPDATYFDGMDNTIRPDSLRYPPAGEKLSEIWDAGWHCSYCFDSLAKIANKLVSFSHKEYSGPEYTNPSKVLQRVRMGKDMFGRGDGDLHRVDNNKDVPGYLVRNAEKYAYMLDRDSENAGFEDAWELIEAEEAAVAV